MQPTAAMSEDGDASQWQGTGSVAPLRRPWVPNVRKPFVETVVVPEGPDIADQYIADRAGPGDICVTGDIPLAARCLEAGAAAVRHNGDLFTASNIGQQLAVRDLMADLRAADPFRQGSGKTFSRADRSRFLQALDRLVRQAARPEGGKPGG